MASWDMRYKRKGRREDSDCVETNTSTAKEHPLNIQQTLYITETQGDDNQHSNVEFVSSTFRPEVDSMHGCYWKLKLVSEQDLQTRSHGGVKKKCIQGEMIKCPNAISCSFSLTCLPWVCRCCLDELAAVSKSRG